MSVSPQAVLYNIITASGLDERLRRAVVFDDQPSFTEVASAAAAADQSVLAFQGHPEHDILGVLNLAVVNTFTAGSGHDRAAWKIKCIRLLLDAGMDAASPFMYRRGMTSTFHLLAMESKEFFYAAAMNPSRQRFSESAFADMVDALVSHGADVNQQLDGSNSFATGDMRPMEIALNIHNISLAMAMASRGGKWRVQKTCYASSHAADLSTLPIAVRAAAI